MDIFETHKYLVDYLKTHYDADNLVRQLTPTFDKTVDKLFDIEHGCILVAFSNENSLHTLTIYTDQIFTTHHELIDGKDKDRFDGENYISVRHTFERAEDAIKDYNFKTGEFLPYIEE